MLYEDLESYPVATIRELIDFCGMTARMPEDWQRETDPSNARLKRQRDAVNSQFIEQFRRHFSLTQR